MHYSAVIKTPTNCLKNEFVLKILLYQKEKTIDSPQVRPKNNSFIGLTDWNETHLFLQILQCFSTVLKKLSLLKILNTRDILMIVLCTEVFFS